MRIGELAEQAGVSVQTVRYYERRDLLPAPDRTASGYRSYVERDLLRLRFIVRGKSLGFTLAEIRDLLGLRADQDRPVDDVRQRALAKIADTESKIRDLERIRGALRRLVNACNAHDSIEQCALMHAIGAEEDF